VREHCMSSCRREPRLKDLLADSVVKAVMEADGVDLRKLEAELQETAALLLATRRQPKSPDARNTGRSSARH
jgi:hypothetical protein